MSDTTFDRARNAVFSELSASAAAHSERTSITAREMARRYGVDEDTAALAGILHDISREESDAELLAAAAEAGLDIGALELARPHILHSRVGALRVRALLPDATDDVVGAVASHTLGSRDMSKLAKIVYVADMIESGRDWDGVAGLRRDVEERDLDEVFRRAYAHSMTHLIDARKPIHPSSVEVWNSLVAGGPK